MPHRLWRNCYGCGHSRRLIGLPKIVNLPGRSCISGPRKERIHSRREQARSGTHTIYSRCLAILSPFKRTPQTS